MEIEAIICKFWQKELHINELKEHLLDLESVILEMNLDQDD